MKTNLHLVYPGTCREAFAFYEETFGSKILMTMTYGQAPPDAPSPADSGDLVMHTAMPLGSMTLMGCDSPRGREEAMGSFQISLEMEDESEVKRLFTILSKDGRVMMPPTPTFWSPLSTMFKDRFGVGWMLSVPGPQG